jgi:hypothetical protein
MCTEESDDEKQRESLALAITGNCAKFFPRSAASGGLPTRSRQRPLKNGKILMRSACVG